MITLHVMVTDIQIIMQDLPEHPIGPRLMLKDLINFFVGCLVTVTNDCDGPTASFLFYFSYSQL